jgi:hypothetical protein
MGLFNFLRIIMNIVFADRGTLAAENLALRQQLVVCQDFVLEVQPGTEMAVIINFN